MDDAQARYASPIERDEDEDGGYEIVESYDELQRQGHPKTPVTVRDYRRVVTFLPFAWERWIADLKAALERQQVGAFDSVVVGPRLEVEGGKVKRYQCSDVVFRRGSWYMAFELGLSSGFDFAGTARELVERARYRLARWENRRKGVC